MMEMSDALDLGRAALLKALTISGPILGVGLLVGIVISLIQTITQLQDQTFNLVPKIVAMVVATVLFVPWLASRLVEYTQLMFAGQ